MSSQNLHEKIKVITAIEPVAMTTVAGLAGRIFDRKGYNGVEFAIGYGAITATDATITVVLKEGDTSGALTSVADTYLCGTEALAGIGQAVRADYSTEKTFTRLGYKGNKRFLQLSIAAASVTATVKVSAAAILFAPEAAAVSNP